MAEQVGDRERSRGGTDEGRADGHAGDFEHAASGCGFLRTCPDLAVDLGFVSGRQTARCCRPWREGIGRVFGRGERMEHHVEVLDMPRAKPGVDDTAEPVAAEQRRGSGRSKPARAIAGSLPAG